MISSIREVNETNALEECGVKKYTMMTQRDHICLAPYIRPQIFGCSLVVVVVVVIVIQGELRQRHGIIPVINNTKST